MKTRLSLLALTVALPFTMVVAQDWDDDIYGSSSKRVEKTSIPKQENPSARKITVITEDDNFTIKAKGDVHIDVDAYNRRYSSTEESRGANNNPTDGDFEYTDRIVKFHNPKNSVTISSDDAINVYVVDDRYNDYYTYRNHYFGFGWSSYYPWYSRSYWGYDSWYNPWYTGYSYPYWRYGYSPYYSLGWYDGWYSPAYYYGSWYGGYYGWDWYGGGYYYGRPYYSRGISYANYNTGGRRTQNYATGGRTYGGRSTVSGGTRSYNGSSYDNTRTYSGGRTTTNNRGGSYGVSTRSSSENSTRSYDSGRSSYGNTRSYESTRSYDSGRSSYGTTRSYESSGRSSMSTGGGMSGGGRSTGDSGRSYGGRR